MSSSNLKRQNSSALLRSASSRALLVRNPSLSRLVMAAAGGGASPGAPPGTPGTGGVPPGGGASPSTGGAGPPGPLRHSPSSNALSTGRKSPRVGTVRETAAASPKANAVGSARGRASSIASGESGSDKESSSNSDEDSSDDNDESKAKGKKAALLREKRAHWEYLQVSFTPRTTVIKGRGVVRLRPWMDSFRRAYWTILATLRLKDTTCLALNASEKVIAQQVFDKVRVHSVETLRIALRELGQDPPLDELNDLMDRVQYRRGDSLPFRKFDKLLQILKKRWVMSDVPDTVEAFVALGGNIDGSGEIDADCLRQVVASIGLTIDIDKFIEEADEDGSGEIDFDEFSHLFKEEGEDEEDDEDEDGDKDDDNASLMSGGFGSSMANMSLVLAAAAAATATPAGAPVTPLPTTASGPPPPAISTAPATARASSTVTIVTTTPSMIAGIPMLGTEGSPSPGGLGLPVSPGALAAPVTTRGTIVAPLEKQGSEVSLMRKGPSPSARVTIAEGASPSSAFTRRHRKAHTTTHEVSIMDSKLAAMYAKIFGRPLGTNASSSAKIAMIAHQRERAMELSQDPHHDAVERLKQEIANNLSGYLRKTSLVRQRNDVEQKKLARKRRCLEQMAAPTGGWSGGSTSDPNNRHRRILKDASFMATLRSNAPQTPVSERAEDIKLPAKAAFKASGQTPSSLVQEVTQSFADLISDVNEEADEETGGAEGQVGPNESAYPAPANSSFRLISPLKHLTREYLQKRTLKQQQQERAKAALKAPKVSREDGTINGDPTQGGVDEVDDAATPPPTLEWGSIASVPIAAARLAWLPKAAHATAVAVREPRRRRLRGASRASSVAFSERSGFGSMRSFGSMSNPNPKQPSPYSNPNPIKRVKPKDVLLLPATNSTGSSLDRIAARGTHKLHPQGGGPSLTLATRQPQQQQPHRRRAPTAPPSFQEALAMRQSSDSTTLLRQWQMQMLTPTR